MDEVDLANSAELAAFEVALHDVVLRDQSAQSIFEVLVEMALVNELVALFLFAEPVAHVLFELALVHVIVSDPQGPLFAEQPAMEEPFVLGLPVFVVHLQHAEVLELVPVHRVESLVRGPFAVLDFHSHDFAEVRNVRVQNTFWRGTTRRN